MGCEPLWKSIFHDAQVSPAGRWSRLKTSMKRPRLSYVFEDSGLNRFCRSRCMRSRYRCSHSVSGLFLPHLVFSYRAGLSPKKLQRREDFRTPTQFNKKLCLRPNRKPNQWILPIIPISMKIIVIYSRGTSTKGIKKFCLAKETCMNPPSYSSEQYHRIVLSSLFLYGSSFVLQTIRLVTLGQGTHKILPRGCMRVKHTLYILFYSMVPHRYSDACNRELFIFKFYERRGFFLCGFSEKGNSK